MKAIVQDGYGGSEVLSLAALDTPVATPGRVLVRVEAAGVNMADWHLMAGSPALVRAALGFRRPRQRVRGEDVAGVVEAVGAGVRGFVPGDRVFGSASGSFAQYVSAAAEHLATIPEGVSFEDAAASPMAGYTALQALRAAGDAGRGRVVVTGAGGGVGSFLVQIAVARGARVTAVCSAGKAAFVRALGAEEVLDYRTVDVTAGSRRFDAAVDVAGGAKVSAWKRVLVPGAPLVLVGDETSGAIFGPLGRAAAGAVARGIRVTTLMANPSAADLAEVARLLADGTLRPHVARVYPLAQAGAAIEDVRAARHPGKSVISPGAA